MSTKPAKPAKHIPQRTCVGCRTVMSKRALVRVVRTPEGVLVDPSGKVNGRGAYLHTLRACWERGLKGALAHALKTELTAEDRARLESFVHALPPDASNE